MELVLKNSPTNTGDIRDTWVQSLGKIPQRRKWQITLVLLLGESHGYRSLAGYGPEDCKESDTTEKTLHAHIQLGQY